MDRIVYNALTSYYHALEMKGYMPHYHAEKLLVLTFFRDFILEDYRGLITKSDYRKLERALDCLYGSTCLIPYPDYLKMRKLNLGSLTEIAQRVKNVENTEVLKAIDADGTWDSDIIISAEDVDNDDDQPTVKPIDDCCDMEAMSYDRIDEILKQ